MLAPNRRGICLTLAICKSVSVFLISPCMPTIFFLLGCVEISSDTTAGYIKNRMSSRLLVARQP